MALQVNYEVELHPQVWLVMLLHRTKIRIIFHPSIRPKPYPTDSRDMADLSKQMNHISVCDCMCVIVYIYILHMITYVENTAPPHLQQTGDPVSPILDQLGYPMIVLWPHPVFVGKCTSSTCTLCR